MILVSCSCSRYPITSLVSTFQTIISPYSELVTIRLPHSENLQMLSSYKNKKNNLLSITKKTKALSQWLTVFKAGYFNLYNSFQDNLSTTTISLLDGYARQLPSVHLKEGVQYDLAVKKELHFGTILFQICIVRFSSIFHTRIDPSALEDA